MISIDVHLTPVVLDLPRKVRADSALRLYAHQELARFCAPYVPASSDSMLAESAVITAEGVRYPGPYAHYQYTGEVYGPNIPIRENGDIVRWVSPKGKPKHPTGRKLQYSKQMHPLAQDHWDQAAMAVHKEDLADELKLFIASRIRKG